MLYLKSCPRCSGDMYLDRDYYGAFKECLQCGFVADTPAPARATVKFRRRRVRRSKAAA